MFTPPLRPTPQLTPTPLDPTGRSMPRRSERIRIDPKHIANGQLDPSGGSAVPPIASPRRHLIAELMRELGTTAWAETQAACSPASRRQAIAAKVADCILAVTAHGGPTITDVRIVDYSDTVWVMGWSADSPLPLCRSHRGGESGWNPSNPLSLPEPAAPDYTRAPLRLRLMEIAPEAFDADLPTPPSSTAGVAVGYSFGTPISCSSAGAGYTLASSQRR